MQELQPSPTPTIRRSDDPTSLLGSADDRRLDLLHDVSRRLTAILDPNELLEQVAEAVEGLIEFQLFGVMLWNEERQQLESAVAVRRDGCTNRRRELALGEGLCGTAALRRTAIRVADVRQDERFVDCCDARVRSELVVPMLVEDRLLGVIDLESYRRDAFDADDERLLTILADNLAVALENARLHARVREDERRLARELAAAREMQRILLPNRSPWLPGLQTAVAYCPARQLGGDLYDFLDLGEGRTGVVVGDVAGKGTGAALYGSLAIGLLRGAMPSAERSSCCLLSHLNAELHSLRAEKRFLALSYAIFDLRRGTLSLTNAGLPYPWLIRGGEAREIQARGLPLGAMARADHRQVTLDLEPGDAVVFATDGIDEGRAPSGDVFGADGVRAALEGLAAGNAKRLADGLLATSTRHLAGREPEDDRTVVVVRLDT